MTVSPRAVDRAVVDMPLTVEEAVSAAAMLSMMIRELTVIPDCRRRRRPLAAETVRTMLPSSTPGRVDAKLFLKLVCLVASKDATVPLKLNSITTTGL